MKRKQWLHIGTIIMVVGFISCVYMQRAENMPVWTTDPLAKAMQATGAELCVWEMNGWVNLDTTDDAAKRAEELITQTFKPEPADLKRTEEENSREKIIQIALKQGNVSYYFNIKKIKTADADSETYLAIKMRENEPDQRFMEEKRQRVVEFLQLFQSDPHITTCLKGYLDGKLRKGMIDWYIQDGMAAAGAQVDSLMEDEHFVSATGYSPFLPNYVEADGKRVNVNLAMRYHSFDDRTYVTIGSPVIITEY